MKEALTTYAHDASRMKTNEHDPAPPQEIEYDDDHLVRRNSSASKILLFKMMITVPFNLIGIVAPERLAEYIWILYIEAFHHYHARIFYLLALHRNVTQFYCALWGNGIIQRRLVVLEVCFDVGLICLYVHEYFALRNVAVFFNSYTAMQSMLCVLSLYSLRITGNVKYRSMA